jgi:hypothetical protein
MISDIGLMATKKESPFLKKFAKPTSLLPVKNKNLISGQGVQFSKNGLWKRQSDMTIN